MAGIGYLHLSDCLCYCFDFLDEEDLGIALFSQWIAGRWALLAVWVGRRSFAFVLNLERITQDCRVLVVSCPLRHLQQGSYSFRRVVTKNFGFSLLIVNP